MECPGWLPSDSQSWFGWPVVAGPRCVVEEGVACAEETMVREGCVACDFVEEDIVGEAAWLAAEACVPSASDSEAIAAVMMMDFMTHSFRETVLQ
jgi:hypothetical protein